jgi:hypothetical protein
MSKNIEQKLFIGENAFNAFMLNEMMDIIASQKVIFESIVEIKANTNNVSFEETPKDLHSRKLVHFIELSEKVLAEYGAIPDDNDIAN